MSNEFERTYNHHLNAVETAWQNASDEAVRLNIRDEILVSIGRSVETLLKEYHSIGEIARTTCEFDPAQLMIFATGHTKAHAKIAEYNQRIATLTR